LVEKAKTIYTLGLIDGIVWHTNLKIKDKKYLSTYRMTYEAFMYLVRELEPFVKCRATMFVKAPLEPIKAIGLVYY
jgi:hypothetical protein